MIKYDDVFDYKLIIYYKDSKVTRSYHFDSIFCLYRFMYKQLKKSNVDTVKVVKI